MEKVGGEGRGRVLGGVSLACEVSVRWLACEVARARALAWPLRWRVGATAPSSCSAGSARDDAVPWAKILSRTPLQGSHVRAPRCTRRAWPRKGSHMRVWWEAARLRARLRGCLTSRRRLSAFSIRLPSAALFKRLPSAALSKWLPSAALSKRLPSAALSKRLPSAARRSDAARLLGAPILALEATAAPVALAPVGALTSRTRDVAPSWASESGQRVERLAMVQ